MKKIAINLSPQKETVAIVFLRRLVCHTPLMVLISVLVLVVIMFLQISIFKQAYDYSRWDESWKVWKNKYVKISEIKKEIVNLNKQKNKLEEIGTPKYDIVLIFEAIFYSLPKNVWFETLDFKSGSIILRGHVIKWDEDYLVSLDRFVNSLREQNNFSSKFSNMSIRESKKANFNGVETLKFIIECKK